MRKFFRTTTSKVCLAAVPLAVAAALTGGVLPASAATTWSYLGGQASVDRSPGSGDTWAWVFAGASGDVWLNLEGFQGQKRTIRVSPGQAKSETYDFDVWVAQLCTATPGFPVRCEGWHGV